MTIDGAGEGAARLPRALRRASSFQPGQTQQFIDVAIAADDVAEPNEFFGVLIGQAQRRADPARRRRRRDPRRRRAGNRSANDRAAPRMKLTRPRLSRRPLDPRARRPARAASSAARGRLVLYARARQRPSGGSASKTFSLPGNAARTLRITIPRVDPQRARADAAACRSARTWSRATRPTTSTRRRRPATLRFKRSSLSARAPNALDQVGRRAPRRRARAHHAATSRTRARDRAACRAPCAPPAARRAA